MTPVAVAAVVVVGGVVALAVLFAVKWVRWVWLDDPEFDGWRE